MNTSANIQTKAKNGFRSSMSSAKTKSRIFAPPVEPEAVNTIKHLSYGAGKSRLNNKPGSVVSKNAVKKAVLSAN